MQNIEKTLFDEIFRDDNGNLVIAQAPNFHLIVWGVASLLKLVFTTGSIDEGLDLIVFGSLFTWHGSNCFKVSTIFVEP